MSFSGSHNNNAPDQIDFRGRKYKKKTIICTQYGNKCYLNGYYILLKGGPEHYILFEETQEKGEWSPDEQYKEYSTECPFKTKTTDSKDHSSTNRLKDQLNNLQAELNQSKAKHAAVIELQKKQEQQLLLCLEEKEELMTQLGKINKEPIKSYKRTKTRNNVVPLLDFQELSDGNIENRPYPENTPMFIRNKTKFEMVMSYILDYWAAAFFDKHKSYPSFDEDKLFYITFLKTFIQTPHYYYQHNLTGYDIEVSNVIINAHYLADTAMNANAQGSFAQFMRYYQPLIDYFIKKSITDRKILHLPLKFKFDIPNKYLHIAHIYVEGADPNFYDDETSKVISNMINKFPDKEVFTNLSKRSFKMPINS